MSETLRGAPRFYKTSEALKEKIEQYFEEYWPKPLKTKDNEGEETVLTDKYGNPVMSNLKPTVSGLAYYLGFETRQSIYDYKGLGQDFSYIIKRAMLLIERFHEERLSDSSVPVGSIFWLKNHGWFDKQEVEHSGSVKIKKIPGMDQEEDFQGEQ